MADEKTRAFTDAEAEEAKIFEAICSDFKPYDTEENVNKMFAEIDKSNLPITVGNLLTVFHLLKNNNQLALAETPEQKARRENDEQQEAARQKRIKEQNANRPAIHSHTAEAAAAAAAEKEAEDNAKKLWNRLDELRKRVQSESAPIVYWEGGPNSGKVNWPKTYDARKKAGFNEDGSRS